MEGTAHFAAECGGGLHGVYDLGVRTAGGGPVWKGIRHASMTGWSHAALGAHIPRRGGFVREGYEAGFYAHDGGGLVV